MCWIWKNLSHVQRMQHVSIEYVLLAVACYLDIFN